MDSTSKVCFKKTKQKNKKNTAANRHSSLKLKKIFFFVFYNTHATLEGEESSIKKTQEADTRQLYSQTFLTLSLLFGGGLINI